MNGMSGPLFNIGTMLNQGLAKRGAGVVSGQAGSFDRIMDLLNQAPKREDPSVLRRIGAIMSAFGPGGRGQAFTYDPARSQEYLDRPYNRELKDWQSEIGPLLQQFDLETQRQDTELGRLKSISEIEGQDALREQREASAQLSKARIAEIVNDINSPDYTAPILDNDRYIMIDKKTMKVMEIPSNRLTEEQRIKMEQAAIGDRQIDVEEVRGKNRIAAAAAGKSGTEDPLSPNEQRTSIANKAAEVRAKYPDLAPYIQFLPNGTVSLSVPQGVDEETGKEQLALARRLIYPDQDVNLPAQGRSLDYEPITLPMETVESMIKDLISEAGLDRATAIEALKKRGIIR